MPIEQYMQGVMGEDTDTVPGSEMETDVETAVIPKTIVKGKEVSIGDVIRLTVTDMDDDNLTVSYESETETEPIKEGGMKELAAEFD